MNILVVEDDSFKFDHITKVILSTIDNAQIHHSDSIYDAVMYLQDNTPNKIVLDMSLPSHSQKIGEGSPLPMPAGGIEVILELRSIKKNNIPILIVTQYPDIEIENEYYSISEAGDEISLIYEINDITVVLYDETSNEWKNTTIIFLET